MKYSQLLWRVLHYQNKYGTHLYLHLKYYKEDLREAKLKSPEICLWSSFLASINCQNIT